MDIRVDNPNRTRRSKEDGGEEQETAVEAREDPEQVADGPGFTRATMIAHLRNPVGNRLSVAVPFAF